MSKFCRAYGVVGVGAIMSNWNADFDGFPKRIGDKIIASDKSIKYPCRKLWEQQDDSVNMYYKTYTEITKKDDKSIVPRTLREKYEVTFNEENLKTIKDKTSIVKNLLTATDTINFGFIFAEDKANFQSTGVVQFTQGVNVYEDSEIAELPILSPFRNKEDAEQSSLGTMVVVDKAQYLYGVSINPAELNKYIKLGYTDGYTREDYNKFKKTVTVAATALNTVTKVGAENNFALFVETDDTLYLPNLTRLVNYTYENEIDTFDISKIINLVKDCGERVKSVEVYYNPYTVKVLGMEELENLKIINILSGKEI